MGMGLYIHVPFCKSKCPYCDFYSVMPNEDIIEKYVAAVCRDLKKYETTVFDTVYFGGGTPSLIGADRIAGILGKVNADSGAEITVECNPSDASQSFDFKTAYNCGVNRISLGLQSAVDSERKALGRRAGIYEAEKAMERAFSAGITNISLDLMLGISGQTADSLKKSIDFCIASGAKHISAYILKIEEGTFYHKNLNKYNFPDEEKTADFYLECCNLIEQSGMKQYEISNFAFPGYESRHNLKYWHCEEYIGLGPAAHSFAGGRRFYYSRSLEDYINGAAPIDDGEGGDFEEYAMLALRLTEGLKNDKVKKRFGFNIPEAISERAKKLEKYGLVETDNEAICLTKSGFLLSNSVISELIL